MTTVTSTPLLDAHLAADQLELLESTTAAARSAATTLPAATSNCSGIVVPTISFSAFSAVWPPSATTRPGAATTACA